ncbi:hypothetical protein CTAYLR_006470 [Chrysophaeum taylorii]|uniref:RING-CH-type domain-containing protein n=1 Tax=Chrysophaeum taylorii TaxID=2483200 RepID=A0AAD7XSZ4_9STRA|nr:hypothetical protein CTAYLR_006470 [Chrysophaeum taylorii]
MPRCDVCRICYSEEYEDGKGPFIRPTPCRCSGERSSIHFKCLERWQSFARNQAIWDAGRRCHACGSTYKVTLDRRIPVGILGGTGLVGRALAAHLATHPLFRVGPVVGSNATVGKPLAEVWRAKEAALEAHYGRNLWKAAPCPDVLDGIRVASVEDLIASRCAIAVSAVAPALGHVEEALQAAGVAVFSMSPHARDDPRNPLVVPEVNGMEWLGSSERNQSKKLPLFKSPNCVVCGVGVALAALDQAYGLAGLSVTTFQALSGRGDAAYRPADLVVANVYPLSGTVERTDEFQRAELQRLFPRLEKCSVAAQRVPVRNGHFVRAGCALRRKPANLDDVRRVLRDFSPLRGLALPSAPSAPIVVLDDVGRPRPADDAHYEGGMAVAVGDIRLGRPDDLFDLSFALVVNNLVRGAYGAALLNAELYELHVRHRDDDPSSERDDAMALPSALHPGAPAKKNPQPLAAAAALTIPAIDHLKK